MAIVTFDNVTARGTKAKFMNALDTIPQVWSLHSQQIPSDAPDENHVWLGMVPEPRLFVAGRDFVDIGDFSFVLTNNEYELSFVVDQNSVEDDRHGLLAKRITDMATVWATFKDSLFAALMIAGESDPAFDGTSFHNASRTIGASGTIDNTGVTTGIGDSANKPTLTEIQDGLKEAIQQMWRFADDTGRTAYNALAMQKLRVVIPPEYHRIFTEAINSDLISTGGSNPFFKNIAEIDVLPYLTDADNAFYLQAVGDPNRMPQIFQERTPVQISVFNSSNEVADNHGLKVLARQRFVFGYGEPRRSFRFDFTA